MYLLVSDMATLDLSNDRIFRLAFPPTIKKGDWYIGFQCRTCNQNIIALTDPSLGKTKPATTGNSKFSIPCQKCGADLLYGGQDLINIKANFSAKSFRDLRPEISKTPKQPMLPIHKKAKPTFGIGALEQRPMAAQVIARCIAYWTSVETTTARLLSRLIGTNTDAAIAVYLTLRNNSAKRSALDAAAKVRLNTKDLILFDALLKYRKSIEKDRNDMAHGVFGIAASIKTGVLWTTTQNYTDYSTRVEKDGVTEELRNIFHRRVYVYEIGTLEYIACEIENLERLTGIFNGYLLSDSTEWKDQRYIEICAEPAIAKELI